MEIHSFRGWRYSCSGESDLSARIAPPYDVLSAEDKEQLLGLRGELKDLWRKLPDELKRGEDRLAFDDPQRLREILEDVQPLLCSRLLEETE